MIAQRFRKIRNAVFMLMMDSGDIREQETIIALGKELFLCKSVLQLVENGNYSTGLSNLYVRVGYAF